MTRYTLTLAWAPEEIKWLAEVSEAGRVIDQGFFTSKAAARRWFKTHYADVR